MSDFTADMNAQLKTLRANFRAIGDKVDRETNLGMISACQFVVGETKKNIQQKEIIDTGMLLKSITYRLQNTSEGVDGVVGTNVEYAAYNEYGTSRGLKPRPFLGPALKDNLPKIIKILNNELRSIK